MQYQVIVTRDATESVTVTVEADNAQDADDNALAYAQAHLPTLQWEVDDGNYNEPYIGAPGEAEPVEEAK